MRKLSVLLMLIGLASAIGVSSYLDRLYSSTRPTAADAGSGYVFVHHVRGGPGVYVTQAEHWAAFGSFAGGILLAALGGSLFTRSMRRAGSDAA
jgi:hypothetical protein